MYIVREFNHQSIKASHFKIGIQYLKLWNLEEQFWGPILKPIENREKVT